MGFAALNASYAPLSQPGRHSTAAGILAIDMSDWAI
jgi:hypothetical protein